MIGCSKEDSVVFFSFLFKRDVSHRQKCRYFFLEKRPFTQTFKMTKCVHHYSSTM